MLNYIARYFTLNRRERNGIIALSTLVLGLIILKSVIIHRNPQPTASVSVIDLDSLAAQLSVQTDESFADRSYGRNASLKGKKKDSLFYFDPNTVNRDQALALGFDKKCADMLMSYRNKGGKFFKAEDLQKLYCMNEELYGKLKRYIIIAGSKQEDKKEKAAAQKNNAQVQIEINSADSTEWMKLRGIGPGYSRRILKYRTILGGFTQVEQISEVYNFPDSVYQAIKGNLTVNPALVQKLKVNTAEFKTLVHHPYIKYEGTKCIFALKRDKKIREQDLINSSCFSREMLQKILPYLDFE
jgi:competence protein ComEA